MDISLLISTYNRAGLLAQTLEHIRAQAIRAGTRWEVIVVDNNCTDSTPEVVRSFAEGSRFPAIRYLREPRQGVGFGRRLGLLESCGELVAFVDDDCLLASDWIEQSLQFARDHPRAGAFGGKNELLFEAPNPVAELYGVSLARQDWGDRPHRLPSTGRKYPIGAGLVLRREAILASKWIEIGVLTGRCADQLSAGEDAEIVMRIRHAGWEVWYAPQLKLLHVIPGARSSLPYLRRLHRGFGQAEPFLRALSRTPSPTYSDRLIGLGWAVAEIGRVLARWPRGYVQYTDERSTWLIRWSHAIGCVEGAVRYLLIGPVGFAVQDQG
jgi:glycosyltransferase involved in cell wall biosynthesis